MWTTLCGSGRGYLKTFLVNVQFNHLEGLYSVPIAKTKFMENSTLNVTFKACRKRQCLVIV